MTNNIFEDKDDKIKQTRQSSIDNYKIEVKHQYASHAPAFSAPLEYVKGDLKIRYLVLLIVGTVLVLLVLFGFVIVIYAPDGLADYWKSVIPIISGALFGFIGYIVGQTVSASSP